MATLEKERGKLYPLAVFSVFGDTILQQQVYTWDSELNRRALVKKCNSDTVYRVTLGSLSSECCFEFWEPLNRLLELHLLACLFSTYPPPRETVHILKFSAIFAATSDTIVMVSGLCVQTMLIGTLLCVYYCYSMVKY